MRYIEKKIQDTHRLYTPMGWQAFVIETVVIHCLIYYILDNNCKPGDGTSDKRMIHLN